MSTAFAPGKLILCGEHAVVYGHRAIAAALSLGTTVTLRRRPGPSGIDESAIVDPRLWPALATLLPADGVGVRITSTLPVGCGLGSSAALAVATVRAFGALEGREVPIDEQIERAWTVERVFHGTPSGLDHTVSARGGVLLYRKGETPEALRLARPLRLVVADTGSPGNTAEMVAGVRARGCDAELQRIGALVEMVVAHLARGEDPGPLFRYNHELLRAIGVSTPRLDAACAAMEAAGSTGAKLAGAGGGGVAFAVVDAASESAVVHAAEAEGCATWRVDVVQAR